jgi:hypothetical protein
MDIPFTKDQFLNLFRDYNQSVFPVQIIFYILALYGIYLLFKNHKNKNIYISSLLAFLWFWIGIVYHIIFFSTINKAAYFFGILFIIQGLLFAIYGIFKGNITFESRNSIYNYIGVIFILYALIIYPILGHLLGHQYPNSPTFGLPCPTTIFTFGLLLFVNKRISVFILIIPLLWSVIGFGAALNLSIYEDYGLLIAGVIGIILLLIQNKKMFVNAKTV